MYIYYLFSKTNCLIPIASCVRRTFVSTQSTFTKFTDQINYNQHDPCQWIGYDYWKAGTLWLLFGTVSGKATAEQMLLVAEQSNRCYKGSTEITCHHYYLYLRFLQIHIARKNSLIIFSIRTWNKGSYNVSLTPKPFASMLQMNIYCSNIFSISHWKWTNAIIFYLKHIYPIIRINWTYNFKKKLFKKKRIQWLHTEWGK